MEEESSTSMSSSIEGTKIESSKTQPPLHNLKALQDNNKHHNPCICHPWDPMDAQHAKPLR